MAPPEDLSAKKQIETQKQLQHIEVFVRKLQAKAGGGSGAAGISTWSSACTSACFSSASTLCAKGVIKLPALDPELADVFATLHRRGIETLGEQGFMDAILNEAKKVKPIDIVAHAEERDK